MKPNPQLLVSGVGATRVPAARSLAMAALLALAATVSAQTNGTWTGADGATWNTSNTSWSGVSGTPWDSTNGTTANATFSVNATSGSASVSGTVFANTITFSPVGGNFLIANGTITLAGTTPTINNFDPSGTLTLSSTVAGSAGLISRGAGTLVLAGNNTYTGTTSIRGGPLVLDYSGLSNTADPLSTGAVTIESGALTLKGKTSGATTETISTFNFQNTNVGFANSLTLDSNGGTGIALTISTFNSANNTNSQNINLIDLSSNAGNSLTISALGSGAKSLNSVLMGSTDNSTGRANLVVRDSTGYGFATLSGGTSGTLGRLSTGTTLNATLSSNTANYRVAGTVTRTVNLDYSTITLDSTAGAVTLAMGTNNLAPNGNGRGILVTGPNDVSITGSGRLEGTGSTWFHNYSTGTFTYGLSTSLTVSASLMFGGSGLTVWTGNSTKTSGSDNLYIEGGIFRPTAAQNWTTGSGIFTGGVWVSSGSVLEVGADLNGATAGDLTNTIGNSAGSGHIRFWGNSGVSAFGGDRIVGFRASGSLQSLTWGGSNFLTDAGGTGDGNYVFKLSSNRSDSTVTVQNAIALGSLNRTVEVADGSAATDAILSGVLSGTGGLVKSGAGALTLSNAANTYTGATTINAGTLSISAITNGGVAGALGNSTNAAGNLVLGGGTLEYTGTASGTTNRDFTLTAGTTSGISVANSTVSLTISGNAAATTGSLAKSGAGTLVLSGANAYTGNTIINAGTLQLGAGSTTGSLSSSSAITNNGTLAINRSDAITISNTISGTGNLTKLGTNTLTLSGASANTYTGTTTVSNGTLTLDKTSGVVAVGGDLVLNGSSKLLYGASKNEQIANTASITINGSQSVFNGSTWNSTTGTIQSNITETIGGLTIRDGQFNTGTTSNWTVTGAGVFDGSSGDARFAAFSGTSISFNSLSLNAMTGTTIGTSEDSFVLGGNQPNVTTLTVGSGGLTLNGSILSMNLGAVAGGNGSRLILDGNITTTGSSASSIGSYSGTNGTTDIRLSSTAGTITRTITTGSGADLTISVAITNGNATTGGIIKDGLGTLTLNRTNTYTGATTINSGTLSIASITNGGVAGALGNSTNAAGNLVLGGGTLEYTGTVDGTTDRNFTLSAGTTSGISVANSTVSLTISGAAAATNGGLAKSGSGSLVLSGANAYTGDTTISAGTLEIASTGRLGGGTYSGNITNNGAFNFNSSSSQTLSGIISGTGNLTKSGAGTLTLSNANTYQGTTTINAGAINLTGSNTASATTINAGASLIGTGTAGAVTVNTGGLIGAGNAAATPGTLTVGALTLNGGGGYTWDLSDATTSGTPGTNWDLITATSTTIGATSGDKFTIFLTGNPTNWSPATTYSAGWNILQWGTLNSVFDANAFTVNTNNFTGATPTGTWAFSSTGGFLNLSYTAPSSSGIWTAAGGNWSTAGNWQGSVVPANNSPLEFNGSGGVSTNDSDLTSIAGITFNSGAGSYTLDGAALSITGGITNNSSSAQTVAIALTMGGAQTFNAGAANLTISGSLANAGNTLTASGSNTVAISGNISGAGGLTKNGAGSLVLSGANTYTGATIISDGNLVLDGSLTGTDITVSVANFTQSGTGSISGAGKTFVVNSGNVTLAGTNTYTGATTINAGNFSITGSGSLGSGGIYAANISNNGTLTLNTTAAQTLSGVVSGSGALVKSNTNTLTLSGSNTYTGATTVSAGVLSIQNANGLGDTANGTTVASGGALQLQGGITIGAEALSLAGTGVSADGALRNISSNNNYGGNITLAASSRINSDAGLLTLTGGISGTQDLIIGGAGNTTISNTIATSTGTLTKDGLGTLILSGANTYTGATAINAGTLQIGAGSTTGSLSSSSAITNNGTLAINRSNAITISNAIGGTGNLTKLGTNTLMLSGASANTYTGTTTVSAGTLTLDKTSGVVAVGGNLVLNGSSTLTYNGTKNEQIANTASVTINGNSLFNGSGGVGTNTGAFGVTETIGSLTVTNGQFNTGTLGNWTVTGAGVFDGSTGDTRFVGFSSSTISFNSLSLTAMTGTALYTSADSFVMGGAQTTVTTLTVGSGGLTLNGSTLGLNKGSSGHAGSRLILNGNITTSGSTASFIASNSGTVGISDIQLSSTAGSVTRTITTGSGADLTISVPITNGSATTAGIIKDGPGTLTLSGNNTYNGATTVAGGTLLLSGNGTLGTSTISISGGTLDMGGKSLTNTFGSLTGGTLSNGTLANTGGNYNLQSGTVSAVLAGTNGVNKTTSGTVTLSNANTFTGTTTVNNGTLTANATNALGGTTHIDVHGGSLLVAAANAVNDDASINLNGGTLAVSGTFNENVGALTLSKDSIIDFSGFVGTLRFSGVGSWASGANLAIWNWSGRTQYGTDFGTYPNSSNLVFTNNATLSNNLANISFYSGNGSGFIGNGFEVSSFSDGFGPGSLIIAVPEPETYITAVALLLGFTFYQLRLARHGQGLLSRVTFLRSIAKRRPLGGSAPGLTQISSTEGF